MLAHFCLWEEFFLELPALQAPEACTTLAALTPVE